MNHVIEIVAVDPRAAAIGAMIETLDKLMAELYPAESCHLTTAEELSSGANRFFAAKVDGKPLGCGAIRVVEQNYAEVKRIYVDPTSRGLGLAKAIMNRLERESRLLGLPVMYLETGTLQPDAISLFERFGFTKCPAFGDYPEDDPYSYFMKKKL